MYIPKYFKVGDFEEILEFVQQNSFGTIVTTKKGKPIATHLPLQLMKLEDEYFITGHMAFGNSQWRTFESCEDVLVMFQGPHAYISSSWYEQENVPTWNYQAVHLYGTAQILTVEELKQDLASLMYKYESHRESPVLWDTLSPELLEKELKGVVGFKIPVREVQAAYKISQNRNEEDYQKIIDRLQQEESPISKQMSDVMNSKSKKSL